MAGGGGAGAGREEGETVVEPGRDLGEGQDVRAGRGQLDGQRDAVEPLAHEVDCGIAFGRRTGPRCGPLDEETTGVLGGERRHAPGDLAPHPQRFPGRGQDNQSGAGP